MGLKHYDQALELFGKFTKQYKDSEWLDRVWYDVGWCHREKKEPDKMKLAFEKVISDFPNSEMRAESFFGLGELEYDNEKYKPAQALYLQAIKAGKEEVLGRAVYKLAWTHTHLKEPLEAVTAYRRIIDELPNSEFYGEAFYRLGRLYQEAGSHDQAVDAFEKCLKNTVKADFREASTFQLAEANRELKEWGRALGLYNSVIKDFPKTEAINEAVYGAGICSMELGAIKDAEDSFTRVIEQTETVTAARAELGLGEILMRSGKFPEAAKRFLKVNFIYGYPEWKPLALSKAAQCWEKAEDPSKAKTFYTLLVKSFPDSPQAVEAKGKIGE